MPDSSDEDPLLAEILQARREVQKESQPDYDICVFCDQHLGARMQLRWSASINEFCEARADVNLFYFWRCPSPDCIRCYEPRRFGYFSYGSKMGSQIMRNPGQQPRCGRHEETPFMYIGRSGRSRQYFCPFYRCEEAGRLVAADVVDVEYPIQEERGSACNDERKRQSELDSFRSFASASGLEIDQGSETNTPPPKPDIKCEISGQSYYFELAQIINPNVAERINPKCQQIKVGFSFDQEAPLVEAIKRKRLKKYETKGAPVDLILHFDLRLGWESTVRALIDKHAGLLAELVQDGPFDRVWIFDEWRKSVIWSKART